MSEMMTELRRQAEARLGYRIKAAALASPDRVRLTRLELKDLFDYMWMEDLVRDQYNPVFFSQLHSWGAALAGYGRGLCSNYTHAYRCEVEELRNRSLLTLQLDYSTHSLSGAMERSTTARKSFWAQDSFVDPALGSSRVPQSSLEDEEAYWDRLQVRLDNFVGSCPEELLLLGESAGNPRFVQAVKNVLSARPCYPMEILDRIEEAPSGELERQFLFATSKGAAEFAKRRQEGMARCYLPEECRGKAIVDDKMVEGNSEL